MRYTFRVSDCLRESVSGQVNLLKSRDRFVKAGIEELARALLSFKRPTRRHQTATVPINDNFHLGLGLRQMLLLSEF